MTPSALVESRAWSVAGWTMLHFLWVGGVLGLAAAIGRRSLRSAHPEIRYGLALAHLGALAVAPAAIGLFLLATAPTASAPLTRLGTLKSPADDLPSWRKELPPPRTPLSEELTATAPAPARTSARRAITSALEVAAHALPWVWMIGSPSTFAILATGLVGVERLRRQSRPLRDGEIAELARRLSASLGIVRPVGLAVCERVAGPMLVGVVRPLILIPASVLTGWDTEQIEMMLLHELAHVRRRDNLINLVQRVIESLLFFHPAIWWVSGWIRLEREHCCDRLVVIHTGRARPYAEFLATLAAHPRPPYLAAVAMAERPIVSRIRRILNKEECPMPLSRPAIALAGLLLATPALLIVAQARPAVDPKPKPAPSGIERAKLDDLFAQVRRGAEIFQGVEGRAHALKNMAGAKAALGDRNAARQLFMEAVTLGETVTLDESSYGGHILHWIAQDQAKAGFRDDAISTYRKLRRVIDLPTNGDQASRSRNVSGPPGISIDSMFKGDFARITVYEEIQKAQRELGDLDGARITSQLIRLHIAELRRKEGFYDIASVALIGLQARSGDLAGALRMVEGLADKKIANPQAAHVFRANGLRTIVDTIGANNREGADAVLKAFRREADTIQFPDEFMSRLMRGEFLKAIAGAQLRLGRMQEAIDTATSIETDGAEEGQGEARINCKDIKAEAFKEIGRAQLKAGNRDGAIQWTRSALRLFKPTIHNNYLIHEAVDILARAGSPVEALRVADLQESWYRASLYESIAAIQRETGDEKGATATLQEALKVARAKALDAKPADPKPDMHQFDYDSRDSWQRHVARCQELLGDLDAALETAERIQHPGIQVDALRDIAHDRAASGDLDGAVKAAQSLKDPKDRANQLMWVMSDLTRPR